MALLSLPLFPSPTLPNLYHTPKDHHGCQSHSDQAGGCTQCNPLFGERPSQTYIRWAFPYPPPKKTYGGGETLPYPNLWPLPIPYLGEALDRLPIPLWGSRGAIAIPNLREAVEPRTPNNRHQRYLWIDLKLNSFFSFIRPFRPNGYTTYGSLVIHIYTHWGTDPQPKGSRQTEPDLQRHPYTMKLKNKFSFGPSQDRPLLLSY